MNGDDCKEEHQQTLVISEVLRSSILDINIEWPICRYLYNSRRNEISIKPKPTFIELLSILDGWNEHNEIAIDGMNGTGKSTLASSMNRTYVKVNSLAPRVTTGSNYNFDIVKSFEYMMLQQSTRCVNVCWDRCAYSNLIFYYVHQLMFHYQERPIPTEETEVYLFLNNMAHSTNLLETITFVESIKSVPTIFLVCRDLKYIACSLQHRNSLNDVYNSKEYNYQMAQYHVYKYFANILKYPLFDISEIANYGITLGDLQQSIRRKIDVSLKRKFSEINNDDYDDDNNNHHHNGDDTKPASSSSKTASIVLPDLQSAENLYKDLVGINDDFLVYQYSKK